VGTLALADALPRAMTWRASVIGLVVAIRRVEHAQKTGVRLPQQSRVSMDGITTLDDTVRACQRTNLHAWELVAYAQQLVARKFTYSRLNTWE
jgi:hypothetical protein